MATAKIDAVKLNQLLRKGKSVKECAKFFGVTPSAISQAKQSLNVAVCKNVALENAHRVVDKNLDAVEQLQKINIYANDLLDLLMRWNAGEDEAIQVLESQVSNKKVRVGGQEEFVREFKFKDPRELALKAMAEIRGQLKFQLELFQSLYDLQAASEFQQEVLSSIGEVAPDVRDRIVAQLQQKRALRSAVKFDQPAAS
jgi:predicted transcriptional regulator